MNAHNFVAVINIAFITLNIKGTLQTEVPDPGHIGVNEGSDISLPCGYGMTPSVTQMAWQYNNDNIPFITLDVKSQKLEINDIRFENRVNIDPFTGDLKLGPVKREDHGIYHCFVMYGGLADEAATYNLSAYVPPHRFDMKCSRAVKGSPKDDCQSYPSHEIKTISCTAISSPPSQILWTRTSVDCPKIKDELDCSKQDLVWTCISILRDLCNGSYACDVVFLGKHTEFSNSDPIQILDFIQPDQPKYILWIVLGAIVLIIVVSVTLFILWNIKKNKSQSPTDIKDLNKEDILHDIRRKSLATEHILRSKTTEKRSEDSQEKSNYFAISLMENNYTESPADVVPAVTKYSSDIVNQVTLTPCESLKLDLQIPDDQNEYNLNNQALVPRSPTNDHAMVQLQPNIDKNASINTRMLQKVLMHPNIKKIKRTETHPDGRKTELEIENKSITSNSDQDTSNWVT